MKKIILIFILSTQIISVVIGQNFSDRFGVDKEQVHEVGQLMKEALAIHFLLIKNDIDELRDFLSEYNYIINDDEDNNTLMFAKICWLPSYKSRISIIINKPNNLSEDIQNYLEVAFLIRKEGEHQMLYSKMDGDDINNAIKANFYESFSNMENWSLCDEPDVKCNICVYNMCKKMVEEQEKHGFENVLLSDKGVTYSYNGEDFIYRYSNFLSLSGEGDADGLIMFFGPGKMTVNIEKNLGNFEGKYNTSMKLVSYYNQYIYPSIFNYKEFMAFDLNSRIWTKDDK